MINIVDLSSLKFHKVLVMRATLKRLASVTCLCYFNRTINTSFIVRAAEAEF